MSYSKIVFDVISKPSNILGMMAPFVGVYIGWILDESETQRMIRYRDRSALYGRPPPPPGVKEIPSW